ncbi:MAG: LysR family transcriptional regulator [Candidatus Afipia apatlaquensis]|uniref:LysR family transcriptional regulator n=1 Tax=Candidatus Afipia apatlaquensis TaxID=2712852 RepID=A0A7C9RIU7_9BRAD|nr:LysR family transcriptional regulator [Candidatus Afipia apatlaquensis]
MHPANDIATFVRVVDRGTFAAVADEVGLTASGVSRTISRLEDRLGVKLLHRSTRRLVLTQEGETYLERARNILNEIDAAEAEVTAGRGRPRGLIRVNTGTAFAKHRFIRLLPDFQAQYPDVEIELSVTDRRIDPAADQIDVTIRVGMLADSALIAYPLGEVRRVIAASPAYLARCGTPQLSYDLKHHNCLLLSGFARQANWPMFGEGRRMLVPVKGSVSCDSADLLLDLAIAGAGIVRLGDFLGEAALADGRLVPLLSAFHDEDASPITALVLPGRQNIPRIRVLIDFLKSRMLVRA